MPQTIQLDYDDQPNDAIEKVNRALAAHGLQFVDDGIYHDGYCVYELREVTDVKTAPEPKPVHPFGVFFLAVCKTLRTEYQWGAPAVFFENNSDGPLLIQIIHDMHAMGDSIEKTAAAVNEQQ